MKLILKYNNIVYIPMFNHPWTVGKRGGATSSNSL